MEEKYRRVNGDNKTYYKNPRDVLGPGPRHRNHSRVCPVVNEHVVAPGPGVGVQVLPFSSCTRDCQLLTLTKPLILVTCKIGIIIPSSQGGRGIPQDNAGSALGPGTRPPLADRGPLL